MRSRRAYKYCVTTHNGTSWMALDLIQQLIYSWKNQPYVITGCSQSFRTQLTDNNAHRKQPYCQCSSGSRAMRPTATATLRCTIMYIHFAIVTFVCRLVVYWPVRFSRLTYGHTTSSSWKDVTWRPIVALCCTFSGASSLLAPLAGVKLQLTVTRAAISSIVWARVWW